MMFVSNKLYSEPLVPIGHRIPNELLREIARQTIANPDIGLEELAGLSLICCSWAQTIRPLRWRTVELRSLERLQSLVALLTKSRQLQDFCTRLSYLGQIIVQVRLSCNLHRDYVRPPWTYMVHQALRPLLTTVSITGELTVRSYREDGGLVGVGHIAPFRSLYDRLPYPILGSFKFIKILELYNLQIPNRKTLIKGLSYLTSLEIIRCADIKWETSDLPPVTSALTTTLQNVRISSMNFERESLAGWWLAPLVAHRFPPTRPARTGVSRLLMLSESDYRAIEAMVCCLELKLTPWSVCIRRESLDEELSHGVYSC